MTTLLTRMRPLAAQAARIRLPHRLRRATSGGESVLPATEERLATRTEIEMLQTMFAKQSA